MTSDGEVRAHLSRLIDEEQRLRSDGNDFVAGHAEQTRLTQISSELDACWALLSHRESGRRHTGAADNIED